MNQDLVQKFFFEERDIRGVRVVLDATFKDLLGERDYPAAVKNLLGELVAASVLMSATLKFDGLLSIHAKGDGQVTLAMAEATNERQVRGVVNHDPACEADLASPAALLGNASLAITIEPDKGNRYQGIVPMEKETLAACLEDYFRQSEQIKTSIIIATGEHSVAGILLQELPQSGIEASERQEHWEEAVTLLKTLTPEELLALSTQEILHRLFHEQDLRLVEPEPVSFSCRCSRDKSSRALQSLGEAELRSLMDELAEVSVDCEICGKSEKYDHVDIHHLIATITG